MKNINRNFELAYESFLNHDYVKVIELLREIPENVLTETEDKVAVWEMLAHSYYETMDEKSVDYYKKLAGLYESLKDDSQHFTNLVRVLEKLAELHDDEEQFKTGLKYYDKLIKLFESNEDLDKQIKEEMIVKTAMKAAVVSEENNYIYGAKKYYKKITDAARFSDNPEVKRIQIQAHYQLGNIFIEESKMFDAIRNFKKVIKIKDEYNIPLNPGFLAATYNNLAIASKIEFYFTDAVKYFKESLKYYLQLAKENPEEYLPFVGLTYNNLGNTYVEKFDVRDEIDTFGVSSFSGFGILSAQRTEGPQRMLQVLDKEEGVAFYKKALEVFQKLYEKHPEQYEHYLGTVKHNLGIIHDELERYDEAVKWYEEALEIREKLANKNPDFFMPDLAITLLNLVTLYQGLFESTGKKTYLDRARSYFEAVKPVIDRLNPNLPVIESMKSEKDYFENYFNNVTGEYIDLVNYKVNKKEWQKLRDETLDIDEKINYQNRIVGKLLDLIKKYQKNKTIRNELAVEYTNLFWFYLLKKDLKEARKIKIDYDKIAGQLSKEMRINMAHYHLLDGNEKEAETEYKQILWDYSETRNEIFNTIKNDLFILFRYGVIDNPSSLVGRLEMVLNGGETNWN